MESDDAKIVAWLKKKLHEVENPDVGSTKVGKLDEGEKRLESEDSDDDVESEDNEDEECSEDESEYKSEVEIAASTSIIFATDSPAQDCEGDFAGPLSEVPRNNVLFNMQEAGNLFDKKGSNDQRKNDDSNAPWRITDYPSEQQHRWKWLIEAIVLDYIKKGPDAPAHGGYNGRKRVDDADLVKLIKARFAVVFNSSSDPSSLTGRDMRGVCIVSFHADDR